MNILDMQGHIINEYAQYTRSFIDIADEKIQSSVNEHLDKKHFWPDPLLQFNPAYKSAGSIAELIDAGLLHRDAQHIFTGYSLYQHQRDAIALGLKNRDFVVTSGTGSGKSLTYIGSIFNALLQNTKQNGVVAVIVYPMNALINSQTEEFKKYKANFEKTGREYKLKVGQYTGQEDEATRDEMRHNPPHIILTNYMMLELLMSRRSDFDLRDAIFKNLKYLVFDEMHTYRGRQGADVAMLIRRIRAKCAHEVTCIGTSATMVSGGTPLDQRRAVASVAQTLFGKPFDADQIVQESLERSLTRPTYSSEELKTAFAEPIDIHDSADLLQRHPIANWLENDIALEDRDGTLVRRKPQSITAVTVALAATVGADTEAARTVLAQLLAWMSNVNAKLTAAGQRYTLLPYRIHQFFAQTGSVYVSLDPGDARYVTLEANRYRPDTDTSQPLFPTYFSRTTGAAFLGVTLTDGKLEPRSNRDTALSTSDEHETDAEIRDGYLIIDYDRWSEAESNELLPEEWFKQTKSGRTLNPNRRNRVPRQIWYDAMGRYSFASDATLPHIGWYMPFPLMFDPSSGQIYHYQTRESSKLSELGGGGRSTATTITSVAILKQLQAGGYPLRDQKLLSFTDNRQDAALQAGHFNDFVQVVQLRSAVFHALESAPTGTLDVSEIGAAVRIALGLPLSVYADYTGNTPLPHIRERYNTSFDQYLTYRLLRDAMRNWKVVLPNLEQSGLVVYQYAHYTEICQADAFWADIAPLAHLSSEQRQRFLIHILDYFRFQYAYTDSRWFAGLEALENKLKSDLLAPWRFEQDESIERPTAIRFKRIAGRQEIETTSVGERSAVANYVRDFFARERVGDTLRGEDYLLFIEALFEKLCEADYLTRTDIRASGEKHAVYQLKLTALRWSLGTGADIRTDEIRQRAFRTRTLKPNGYFKQLYSTPFAQSKRFYAQDHTGQLSNEDRIDREERFRAEYVLASGAVDEERIKRDSISTLFCSPTMELGVDIGGLSVVHMRNVPPNPSNYAQRSGRAGRSGQGALVFTYCSNAAHDQHYFRHQVDMVSGAVQPPQLDIFNEDLLRTHIHAIAIAHVGMPKESNSLKEYVTDEAPVYPVNDSVRQHFHLDAQATREVGQTFRTAIQDFAPVLSAQHAWFTQTWVDVALSSISHRFVEAMQRWQELYRSAVQQRISSTTKMNTPGLSPQTREFNQIQREYHDAIRQIALLENNQRYGSSLSEFFPFRYFASEGFLPGYNFTRLPVRVFIPADRTGGQGEYLSRPRGIALSEFGPFNIIYHNGNKYRIQQMILPSGSEFTTKAKVSTQSGYLMRNEEINSEVCPLTQVPLNDAGAYKTFTRLIELNECRALPVDRITCEEEYRVREGYSIETYFAMTGMLDRVRTAEIRHNDEVLMHMRYLPAATIISVNTGWSSDRREGFRINKVSGFWNRKAQSEPDTEDTFEVVTPWTSTIADALYIEPLQPLGLNADGVITLQYALKRALEMLFQVESSEVAATTMGSPDAPNMFLYESAEGSLGLMARFMHDPDAFGRLINQAMTLCAYDDPDYRAPASYRDLLSYYNQPHHGIIDRFAIKGALELLSTCRVAVTSAHTVDYEGQYQQLLTRYDTSSDMEKRFLDYLYKNNLRLPDDAQRLVTDIYVRPDFYYDNRIWVFCDGTPHDQPAVAEHDRSVRSLLRERGDEVLVWHYRTSLETFIQSRPDIFRRVR